MSEYKVHQVSKDEHIHEILSLQSLNHKASLSSEEITREGFVTCEHDFALLKRMNHPCPHIIATLKDKVVGYCLVMSAEHRDELEVLQSMFTMIEKQTIDGHSIKTADYITMGQVCIDKQHRRMGLFKKMYNHFREQLSSHYKYCMTEVATSNTRSLQAHEALGFKNLLSYKADDGKDWELIVWDWS